MSTDRISGTSRKGVQGAQSVSRAKRLPDPAFGPMSEVVFGGTAGRSLASVVTSSRSFLVVGLMLCSVAAGCALPQEVSKTPRNATEQLLLSQSVDRAMEEMALPIPEGAAVRIEVTGLQTDRAHLHVDEQDERFGVIDSPSWDLAFVRDMVAGRLGYLGYRVRKSEEESAYLVRIVVHAMGTNQGKTFFGIPPIQSVIIPFALPQLTLYQELDQLAHVRLHMDIFEAGTGTFVRSTP